MFALNRKRPAWPSKPVGANALGGTAIPPNIPEIEDSDRQNRGFNPLFYIYEQIKNMSAHPIDI